MKELPSQNQNPCHTQITEPDVDQSNVSKQPCQKSIPFDKTYITARHGALARTTSSGISTGPVDRHTPSQSLQTLSLGPCRAKAIFSSESVIIPDLYPSRSRATEFSWTSRSQNLKLLYLNSIEEAFHSNLTTEPRDIHEYVKQFRKIRHAR